MKKVTNQIFSKHFFLSTSIEKKIIKNSQLNKGFIKKHTEIYVPFLHRLSFCRLKSEIEEIAFKKNYFQIYQEIMEFKNDISRRAHDIFFDFTQRIKKKLKSKFKYQCSFRIKDTYSMFNKAQINNSHFSELFDIIAIRVITQDIQDCFKIMKLIQDEFTQIDTRYKNYISNPKKNGYQSLHNTFLSSNHLPFEVQIRTQQMHENAEIGMAAHWVYKQNTKAQINKDIQRIKTLGENLDQLQNLKK